MNNPCNVCVVTMFAGIKRKNKFRLNWKVREYTVEVYPSGRSCVRQNMRHVRPQQLPPLMVRTCPENG